MWSMKRCFLCCREMWTRRQSAALETQRWVAQRAQPTLPSRLIPSSFCASTANSIGNSARTSLQKPLTIMEMASSVEIPRWLQ